MKTRINFLALIFLMSIFAIIFSSCQKEPLVHPLASSKATIGETPSSTQSIVIIEDEIQKQQVSEFNMTYEEALESIDPDVHPDWGVAIKSFTCTRTGESLLVYNPYNPSLDFYDSDRFLVLWFKDSRPVRGNEVRQECVCHGKYAVIVLNKATKQGIGIDFYSAHACYADDFSVANDNN